ncbi:MAG: hydroxyacid dehydrogenase [Rikenellaceae bacterium]|nr:hydroxyacid dehydrogenase [Rikenellaceae bacterium]
MAKIVFLDEYSLGGYDLSAIKSLGEYTGYDRTTAYQTLERCKGATVVITNKVYISRETMQQLPDLKMIAIAATGMNNVDLEAAAELGIVVKNVSGYSTYSVAEATLGAALSLLRNSSYYDNYFKSGSYAATDDIFHFGRPISLLRGKNWGIIGLGAIGHQVAHLADAFGCNIAYSSTSGVAREERYPHKELNELLQWADVISVHSPLNAKTAGLIGKDELAQMKSTAIIINVARGGIIDEAALADALNSHIIAGAALDVFSSEPLHSSPLYSLNDPYTLLASPHTAWAADDAVKLLIDGIATNIKNFLLSLR